MSTDTETDTEEEKAPRAASAVGSPTGLIGKAWYAAVGAFDLIGERIDGLYERGKSKATAKTTPKKKNRGTKR